MTMTLSRLTRRFGETEVLRGIDLEIAPGELIALLGPSGSGKTTLLKIIAGLDWPDAGALSVGGVDWLALRPQDRRTGFVFQNYALFPHMSVRDNVAFGLTVLPRAERPGPRQIAERVEELLSFLQIAPLAERYPSELSGGQRQRVALGRALAITPSVLLLDEPFGALDAQVRKELRDWLRRLHDEVHVTTVFVTHDQEEALEVADEIVVINQGRIEQIGTPDQLYDEPANDFVMGFLGAVTQLGPLRLRPHDIEVAVAPGVPGSTAGVVSRALRIGFEVRLTVDAEGQEEPVQVVLSRTHARALDLELGSKVWLSPALGATAVPVLGAHRAEVASA